MRGRNRSFAFCFLLFLCLCHLFASDLIRIFWVTDNHLKYGDPVLEERLEWFIEEVKREKPDIVIHTGDAIDGKRGREYALKEIEQFVFYWDQIPDSVVTLFVPGNRDIGLGYETAEEDWLFYSGNTEKIAGSFFNRIVDFQKGSIRLRFILVCDFSRTLNPSALTCWLSDALSVNEGNRALFVLSHSAALFPTITDLLKTAPHREVSVYFLHGHEHGGLGMMLQESEVASKVWRYLLGGLQDGYYGAAQTVFQKMLPFLVLPPFYEEIIVDASGTMTHRTIRQP
ncbi:MAG TPA: metallophosphoesterase [Thermotogota bacterium]|nr:metallophosphoesterase [Thermotogota bacterium]